MQIPQVEDIPEDSYQMGPSRIAMWGRSYRLEVLYENADGMMFWGPVPLIDETQEIDKL